MFIEFDEFLVNTNIIQMIKPVFDEYDIDGHKKEKPLIYLLIEFDRKKYSDSMKWRFETKEQMYSKYREICKIYASGSRE